MGIPVSVVKCGNYNDSKVSESVAKCLERIGGMDRFVKPGMRVALKVNLLCAARPSKAITTHPSIVATVARMVKKVGAEAVIVDSPGGGTRYTASTLRDIYQTTGMIDVAERTGARLNYDTSFEIVSFPKGKLLKRLEIIKPILDADAVVNLPKFKTHEFTYLTAAVKNLFGVVPGRTKTGYHAKLRNVQNFSEMLIDISSHVNPCLTVVDAVLGMDGDGPASGRPRELGLILASENALVIDILLAEAVGVDPKMIPYIRAAVDRKLCSGDREDVEIRGETLKSIRILDFVMPKTMSMIGKLGASSFLHRMAAPLFKNMFSVKPWINPRTCRGCGICEESCPERGVRIVDGKAYIDERVCIRCYCCHEICPNKSIELREPFLYTLGRTIN